MHSQMVRIAMNKKPAIVFAQLLLLTRLGDERKVALACLVLRDIAILCGGQRCPF